MIRSDLVALARRTRPMGWAPRLRHRLSLIGPTALAALLLATALGGVVFWAAWIRLEQLLRLANGLGPQLYGCA